MLRLICSKRGFSLIEAVIAMAITMTAVMAIFSLVAPSWRTSTQSDEMGRAAYILYDRLQREEIRIINPNNTVTAGTTGPVIVYASGLATPHPSGDIPFSVTTTITKLGGAISNTWKIEARVTWNNGRRSVADELTVNQQDTFKF